ncbi:MAG TPA: rhodanese-like domain-containing protein [Gaiellaceae bacterium]|nr:rhodanese-like domain-containing protein [Gaiellaceae bacterium]
MDVTADELAARLGEVAVLDVRTPAEFSGERGYPCDPRQGRIPGARNLPVDELVGRPPEEVRELVGLREGAEVVAYCHAGSRSAMAAEARRAAGYAARNYAGSWHEWSRRDDLPAER